jgi:predicted HicB family RNase H-like nuclease
MPKVSEISRSEYLQNYRDNNKDVIKRYNKKYNDLNKDEFRNYHLIKNYNITLEEYNELFIKQNGCCAICGRHQSELKQTLHVDHDHNTGLIRGLLCTKCNIGLGYVNDDINILLKMISYLQKEIEILKVK